jgi:hypothetical protein
VIYEKLLPRIKVIIIVGMKTEEPIQDPLACIIPMICSMNISISLSSMPILKPKMLIVLRRYYLDSIGKY